MRTEKSAPANENENGNVLQLPPTLLPCKLPWETLRLVFRSQFLALAAMCLLILPAPCVLSATEPSIRIQYRELIDDSVYGHSGRPASRILDQLARSTIEGIAKRLIVKDLSSKSSNLENEIEQAEEAKNVVLVERKKAELKEVETILEDEELIAKETDSYIVKNRSKLERLVRLTGFNTKALLSDVEPVCEPVGFVLNDALAEKDPTTLNAELVELGAFYPRGEVEPGWADLIRTRRFVVYTDGGSYCRIFLPGDDAKQAWESAFPVVRHVLLSLLKPNAKGETLLVDVYAYKNDITHTTFTLGLTKFSVRVTAQDLSTPAAMKSLDLTALAQFFADGQTLEGCGIDANGQLVLIGSKEKRPTLEGHPIELSDLAVAYRASAYAGHGESYMSLDKAEDDNFVNVNFGGRLYDTRMGWVAYRCDLRFKTIGDDFDPVTFESRTSEIVAAIPDFESRRWRKFADPAFRDISIEATRFWFYPDDFKIVTAADHKSCLVTRPRFTAAAERQESFNVQGEEMDTKTPAWTSLTLDHFNKNYEKFAKLFPEAEELDHAARLLGVAEWLYQAKQKGNIALDLDELLAISLPANPTPRRREQLRIAYAFKKTGIPAEFKAYCISTPDGRARFERAAKEYQKPTSQWDIMSVVGGGLDYSARKAVEEAAVGNEGQQSILRKTVTSVKQFTAPDGREMSTSTAFSGKGPPVEPPSGGFITASASEPTPKGIGFEGTKRSLMDSKGHEVDSLLVQESGVKRFQKTDAEAFYKDGPLYSVWIGEHGAPERFAINTTKGVITYRLPEKNGIMTAKVIREKRSPRESELDFLAAALIDGNTPPSQVWNLAPVDSEIRAIDTTPGKEALIYFRDAGGDTLRVYKAGGKPSEIKGRAALARLHEASRAKVKAYSLPGKAELVHVASEGESVVLQIGMHEPIRIKQTEWGNWLSAEGESTPPEALARVYNDLIQSDGELIVMRDALQSKPQRLNEKSSQQIDALEDLGKGLLQLELAMLEKSKALSPDERAARISELEAEYKELSSRAIVAKTESDAVALASVLKTKLPRLRVSYDDPSPIVPRRVLREPVVKAATDVGLAIPPGEAAVDDKGILRNVAAAFDQAKIPLIKTPADLEKVGNVIVITAHNNEALFDYLQSLGEYQINGKSALDGKFLMLTTCFEQGNPNMVSELLRRYNCAGVHVQSERVNKDAVRRALVEFSKALRDLKAGAQGERLRDIFDESVKRVLRSDDPGIESLKKELEKLLRARVQWCAIPRLESRGKRSQVFS